MDGSFTHLYIDKKAYCQKDWARFTSYWKSSVVCFYENWFLFSIQSFSSSVEHIGFDLHKVLMSRFQFNTSGNWLLILIQDGVMSLTAFALGALQMSLLLLLLLYFCVAHRERVWHTYSTDLQGFDPILI